ncbi:tripartite tricarboxylate transporter substrate binding protein [Rhizobium sp. CSW-27]|uniref:Bug family tripartite tricarboxylate transporter substrate binding protein n=1 Tax=Rhizobium sp. CSW-27 TaxID=2839985 RepID=UPI001C01FEF4|nr:tripartite tricarboxylate transporter substrate binding protein [Rhizobium sp. CSW-27]MBT9371688.1 tripartite tricarboxylate transporter substrate binding protein [Rhizobium sp. CSW-27]
MLKKLVGAVALSMIASFAMADDFPKQDLQGIIQWGAGGSTDLVMRSVAPHVEKELGRSIVMTNKTGGVGVIATQFVSTQPSDGYTLLMSAENPQLYKIMGLSNLDYANFYPVNVLARGVPVLVANKDAPFNSVKELVDYVTANPGKVRMGSTGPGGLPSVVGAMLSSKLANFKVTAVPFDGDGPALTAMQGGAVDFMPAVLGAAVEHVKAGRIKILGIFDEQASPVLPDARPITADYPQFESLLPWGPFFGVFVKADTPDDVKAKLVSAFKKGAESEAFQKLLSDRGYVSMNIAGDEANAFLKKWQSTTSWVVYDAGMGKKSPDEFGIPKP